jgi:branched-chain amino acid transport system permease protein
MCFTRVYNRKNCLQTLAGSPGISALITAIGVSFFLEYFGALDFVFTSNYITYKRPFQVVSWFIGPSGFGTIKSGVAAPANSIIFSNIFVIIVLASILLLLVLQYVVKRTKSAKPCAPWLITKPPPA